MSSSELKAAELYENFIEGKQVHDILASNIESNLLVNGRNLDDWEEHFRFDININDLNHRTCMNMALRLSELHSEAMAYLNRASIKEEAIKQGIGVHVVTKTAAICEEYEQRKQKRPAASVIEKLVAAQMKEVNSASGVAEVETRFWKRIIEDLNFKRKAIETASMQLMSEAKIDLANGATNRMLTKQMMEDY